MLFVRSLLALATLVSLVLVVASPGQQRAETNRLKLRQATRAEVIDRATRVKRTVRPATSGIPISCGGGQQFVLLYSGSGTSQDGKYGVVGKQSDRQSSSSYTMTGSGKTSSAATVFTLDKNCDLVATAAGTRVANTYDTDSTDEVYFDKSGNYGGDFPVLTCKITTSTDQLTCTAGSNVKSIFAVCPDVKAALYITNSNIPSDCSGVTLTAQLA